MTTRHRHSPGLRSYHNLRRVRDKAFSLVVGREFASFGPHSVIQLPVRLAGIDQIQVGANVFVGANSWLQTLDTEEGPGVITIGAGTSMSGGVTIAAARRVEIGESVLFARHVYVSDHSHAYRDDTRPVLAQGLDRVEPVTIGTGSWLGQNVVVLPGTQIGPGAVIGANSVVRGHIPPGTIAVGAPARVLD